MHEGRARGRSPPVPLTVLDQRCRGQETSPGAVSEETVSTPSPLQNDPADTSKGADLRGLFPGITHLQPCLYKNRGPGETSAFAFFKLLLFNKKLLIGFF